VWPRIDACTKAVNDVERLIAEACLIQQFPELHREGFLLGTRKWRARSKDNWPEWTGSRDLQELRPLLRCNLTRSRSSLKCLDSRVRAIGAKYWLKLHSGFSDRNLCPKRQGIGSAKLADIIRIDLDFLRCTNIPQPDSSRRVKYVFQPPLVVTLRTRR